MAQAMIDNLKRRNKYAWGKIFAERNKRHADHIELLKIMEEMKEQKVKIANVEYTCSDFLTCRFLKMATELK